MLNLPQSEPIPLSMNEVGVAYVGNTRVTLQSVVASFQQGASPEKIIEQFPTLTLPEVYLVIAYYLNHRAKVDDYLQYLDMEADRLRQENEARFGASPSRADLLARLEKQHKTH